MKSNKSFAKRLLLMILTVGLIVVVALMGTVFVSAADTGTDTKTIYLSINGQWTQKLCAVYTWGSDYDNGQWIAMKDTYSGNDLWTVEIPAEYTNINFCSRTAPFLGQDSVKNQTGNLTIPADCDHFTLTGESSGVWDKYNTGADDTEGTRIVYFAPNTEWMYIQGAEGHNFAVHAYNTTADSVGVSVDMTLVQGEYGKYPTIWSAEISDEYTNIDFLRGEGLIADNSWKLWEATAGQILPSENNLFTQDEDVYQDGEWTYLDASTLVPPTDNPDDDIPDETLPDATEPDVDLGETKVVYFTPNETWETAVSASGRLSAYSWGDSEDDGVWTWLTSVSGGRYAADIPVNNTHIYFAISYSTEPDAVWNQTANLTIPADSDHFTQNKNDFTTGSWHAEAVGGVTYSVVFVGADDKLLSAQVVNEGESAIAPNPPKRTGYTFIGWDTDFSCVTDNLTVKALYKADETTDPVVQNGSLKIEIAGGSGFTISVNGGAARPQGTSYRNTKAPVGALVTLVANTVEGVEFMGWFDPVSGVAVSKDYTYSFTTSGNDFVKAMYKVDVTGVNTVIFLNDKAAGGLGQIVDMQYYGAGDEISIPGDPIQIGFVFNGWNMTADEISAAIGRGEDVTVLATWEKATVKVQVQVNGGSGTGTYDANFAVTVVADQAPAGKKFAYWVDGNNNIRSYDETYKFYPSTDISLTAVFVADDAVIDYQVLVSIDRIDTVSEGTSNVFYFSWYVPEEEMDITFVGAGILAVNKDNFTGNNLYVGTTDANVYDRGPKGADIKPINSYSWTKTKVPVGATWVAKAYVQYRTADGTLVTLYSDLVEATKE